MSYDLHIDIFADFDSFVWNVDLWKIYFQLFHSKLSSDAHIQNALFIFDKIIKEDLMSELQFLFLCLVPAAASLSCRQCTTNITSLQGNTHPIS